MSQDAEYSGFFRQAMGWSQDSSPDCYDYQRRLALTPWPNVLDVPTGMGKTAAVTLAWLWKRGWRDGSRPATVESTTPRRLIWCLPMRVLVEQTEESIRSWLDHLNLFGKPGDGKVSISMLMGGAEDLRTWAEFPEEDMILIGTQDMLLSRALMRGYGMSRYQWPIHFSLLHNDCLWVFDEVQLMGAGLTTSTQLEAFRRSFPVARSSLSLWVSATLNTEWLSSVDFAAHVESISSLTIGHEDRKQAIERLESKKHLIAADFSITAEIGNHARQKQYIEKLADLVLEQHDETAQTLVILNRVDRAQDLFRQLREKRPDKDDLLVHARFRASERISQNQRLKPDSTTDRIVVATQAIEAGVDLSSKVLVTELAPWPSIVQRFGRCNRYGEHNSDGAYIHWVDIEDDGDPLPYDSDALRFAREKLIKLTSAGPCDLPRTDESRPVTATLRRKDLLDLFNTDPDLSGFDVDISDYIRDRNTPGIHVFWRDFGDDPNDPDLQKGPHREELCPVSMTQAVELSKRKDATGWYWDALDNRWRRQVGSPRPGMVILLPSSAGCYDQAVGFDSREKNPVDVLPTDASSLTEDFGGDWRTFDQKKSVLLADHLAHVAEQANKLCESLGETANRAPIVRASRWHDLGKAHDVFQDTLHSCDRAPEGLLAKSPCKGEHARRFFRHELASMLAWLAQHDDDADSNLIAYLILAHHGKVRTSLRAMPGEPVPETGEQFRFARGVWEGDILPALAFDGEQSKETTLKLALMEIGYGEQDASWTERVLTLIEEHGPFQLAWLETLVRIADWRASALEQEHGDE